MPWRHARCWVRRDLRCHLLLPLDSFRVAHPMGARLPSPSALPQFLRPHQREGVAFMFECVCGLRKFDGQGGQEGKEAEGTRGIVFWLPDLVQRRHEARLPGGSAGTLRGGICLSQE